MRRPPGRWQQLTSKATGRGPFVNCRRFVRRLLVIIGNSISFLPRGRVAGFGHPSFRAFAERCDPLHLPNVSVGPMMVVISRPDNQESGHAEIVSVAASLHGYHACGGH